MKRSRRFPQGSGAVKKPEGGGGGGRLVWRGGGGNGRRGRDTGLSEKCEDNNAI